MSLLVKRQGIWVKSHLRWRCVTEDSTNLGADVWSVGVILWLLILQQTRTFSVETELQCFGPRSYSTSDHMDPNLSHDTDEISFS